MQNLVALLQATQSVRDAERSAAERALQQASRAPEFAALLAGLLTDEAAAVPLRQLAGVVLKQFVNTHWATMPGDPDASLVVVPEQARVAVKQQVPRALGSPHSKVRTAAAMAIAAIGRADFPTRWPSLLGDLVACLGSPNKALAAGALKCLDFLATSKLADDQVPAFLQTVFPALHGVFASAAFDEAAKSRAASVVTAIVLWVGALASQNPQQYERVVAQSMQMWMDGFCGLLAARDAPGAGCQLKLKVVTIVSAYAHHFPKLFRPYAARCAELIWGSLLANVPAFERAVVQADLLDDACDSDGNVVGFDLLTAAYLEFVATLATKKSFVEVLTKNYAALLRAVFYYAQLSAAQCEVFLSDPNEFVAAEDEDLGAYSIRLKCVELVQLLASMFRRDFLAAMLAEARRLPQAASWKLREAFLYLVGSVMTDLRKHPDLLDYAAFVTSLLPDMASENPFVRGRALWCASQSRDLSPALAGSVCQAALRLLANRKREPLPVRFAAVRAVATLAPLLPPDAAYPALRPAMESCCDIFPVSSPETVPVALETLEALLRVHPRAAAEAAPFVCARALEVWRAYASDEFVTELVVDLVGAAAAAPDAGPAVAAQLLPAVGALLTAPGTEYFVQCTAVELLALLVRGTPRCLANPAFAQLFGRVIALALATDEISLMQATSKALAAFVGSAGASLGQFRAPNGGESGTAAVLAVVRRLLDPGSPEGGALHVGRLLLRLLQTQDLTAATPQLLAATLPRLASSSSPALVQALVLVFARLIHQSPAAVLDFLAAARAPDGSTALALLLRVWTDNQTAFYGSFQTKVTLFALVNLFKLNSPQINAIKVKGPEMAPKGRSMRSKGPIQYSEISVQQKIFEICLAAFVERVLDSEEGGASEEELEGFSSEEDLNLDGSEFDHIGGGHGDALRSLDSLMRAANHEEADAEDEEDPEFKDDPLNRIEILPQLREFLMGLMRSNPKAFEQSVGACGDIEVRQLFYKIWPQQVQAHLAKK